MSLLVCLLVSLFISCLGSCVGETSWVSIVTFLGDIISQQTHHSYGSYLWLTSLFPESYVQELSC